MAAGGLMYTASFNAITVTHNGGAAQGIWEIIAAAGVSLLIHSIRLTIVPTITSGVAQDIRVQLNLLKITTTGTGGVAVTAAATNNRNSTAAVTTFNRTVTTPGTPSTILDSEIVSIIVPYERIYTPDQRIPITGGARLSLSLATGFTDSASHTASSEIYFEEI